MALLGEIELPGGQHFAQFVPRRRGQPVVEVLGAALERCVGGDLLAVGGLVDQQPHLGPPLRGRLGVRVQDLRDRGDVLDVGVTRVSGVRTCHRMPLLESFVDGGGSVASPAGCLVLPPQVNSVWGASEPLFTLSFRCARAPVPRVGWGRGR